MFNIGSGLKVWLLIAIVVAGVYVLPSVVATFSGSHTMELNKSGQIECMQCHTYIKDELNQTANSRSVLSAHQAAAGDTNYAGAEKEINITNIDNTTISGACHMCHLMEQDAINVAGAHTDITIRSCTDTDCHGNSTNYGSSQYPDAGGVGGNISNSADAHSGWYNAMEGQTSKYVREENDGNYSSGFYACMACHTHVEMNMNITRPKAFNINITINESGTFINGPAINYTSPNSTISQRGYGSVW